MFKKNMFSIKNVYKKFVAIFTLALLVSPVSAKAASGVDFTRLSGKSRYDTSAAISENGWTSSEYVVIAQGENFPDALCSVPLAKYYNAPILLTTKDKLNSSVEKEVKRLGATNIILIGGEGSVSSNLEKYIKNNFKNASVERIAGKDRYETSTKIAEKLNFNGEVVVASSMYYADALSIAPVAGKKGMPILLAKKNNLSNSAKNYLKDKNITKSYIVGGEGVIGKNIEKEIKNPNRVAGKNRFETNVEILKTFNKDIKYENVITALGNGPVGNEFADALSGAAFAAKIEAPMVLSDKTLPQITENYLNNILPESTKVYALGGEGVLPDSAVKKIKSNVKDNNEDKESSEDKDTSTGGGGGGTALGEGPKVTKLYLKSSDGTLLNGEISGNDIRINIPKGFDKKIVNVIVSASNNIETASAMGNSINKEEMDKVFGSNRTEIDLIKYIRSKGFDPEKDGVSITNIRLLDETRITLKDDKGKATTYKMYIK